MGNMGISDDTIAAIATQNESSSSSSSENQAQEAATAEEAEVEAAADTEAEAIDDETVLETVADDTEQLDYEDFYGPEIEPPEE